MNERSERHEGAFGRGEFALFPFRGRIKGFPVLRGEDASRIEADEGVAPEAFARLDGFEKKDVFVLLKAREDGDRSLHVGGEFFGDGDEVALLGKVGKFLEGQHGGFDSGRKEKTNVRDEKKADRKPLASGPLSGQGL